MAARQVSDLRHRVGEVWEDQASRVYMVLESRHTTIIILDEEVNGPQPCCIHKVLKLSCGNLTGGLTEIYEFPEMPWEKIYKRHA